MEKLFWKDKTAGISRKLKSNVPRHRYIKFEYR